MGLLGITLDQCFSVSISRDRGCMSKSVYVCAFQDFELFSYMCSSILRFTLMYKIERQLEIPAGMNKIDFYC